MFIRAQFTEETFKNLLKFRTISMARPCPQLFFKDAKPRPLLIKRIEFVGITQITLGELRPVGYPNNAPQTQVFQRNRLVLKLQFNVRAAFLNANSDPDPDLPEQTVNVDVAVDLKVQNGKDILALEVLGTELDVLFSLFGGGKQEMSNLLGTGPVDLGLIKQVGDLSSQIGGSISVRHTDIGFNPTLKVVEVAIEVSDAGAPSFDAVSFWSQFYANQFDGVSAGSPWAMFFDHRLGTSIIARQLSAAIDASGKFRRDGGVAARWDGGFPGYRVSVNGEVIDACRCLWGLIDIDVRLSVDVKFSIINNRLRTDIWVDHKVTDAAESLCCILTAVVFFPIVGLELAITGKMAWYEYLAGLALYPDPVLLLLVALAKLSLIKPDVQVCQKDPADDKHFFCELSLPQLTEKALCRGASMSLRVVSLSGRSDGLVLGGAIDMPAIVAPEVRINTGTLEYKISYGCNYSPDDGERLITMIDVFKGAGNYDFRLCDVTVLGPLEQKVQTRIETMTCPYSAWVTLSIPVQDYDGKPLKVILTTTHGAHHIAIPAAQIPSEKERQKAVLGAIIQKISNCKAKSRRWDIRWLIDPARYINVVQIKQLWALTGVASARVNKVNVLDTGGRLLLAAIDVGQTKVFRLSLISPSKVMTIVQETEGDAGELALLTDSEIHVVQTLLGVERDIVFDGTILAVDTLRIDTQRKVVVHQADQLSLFDVSEFGDLILSGELDTRDALWVGRGGAMLHAQNTDGRLSSLDLGRQELLRWQENPGSEMPTVAAKRGCGCANAEALRGMPVAAEESGLQRESYLEATLQTHRFDHFLHRGSAVPSERLLSARIQGAFWITQIGGVLVVAAVDRKLANIADASFSDPMTAMPTRIGSGMFLALSEDGHALQLLRTLARREV